ncbi:MAG: 1-acyl-sn-glycerol-3-phosphate acyltransferase [Cytophagaceae bacterium]|nr:1-acyl-sn-glycerol-3-phosphate acyltransferase [Gemmatimonadaceae bacterium]
MRIALFAVAAALAALAFWGLARAYFDRSARRALHRFGARVARHKLTDKREIIAALVADPEIARAVHTHVAATGVSEAAAWKRVRTYLDEIVPFFSILAYYKVGYVVSRALLNLFYKVTVDYEREDPFRELPKDAVVVYLMNHRSNADYVLVAYALMGDVSLSYAVGEWARAFPLEYIFKSFGSYFIRRKYREPLYHTVLARYVQHITRNGVTQGIFPEGGLSRDGTLGPAKIGLLDYALDVARDPAFRQRMFVVPVGINYDRVLEDRSLLSELARKTTGVRPPRLRQFVDVVRYVGFNLGRLVGRRWKRYGRAAVTIGVPIPVSGWLDQLEGQGIHPFDLDRTERLGYVQAFCDSLMVRIGALVPVTPVSLACAALQTMDADFVPHDRLLQRMEELREVLRELNARVLKSEDSTEEVFDRAYRMLRMRRVIARSGSGYVILSRGLPLISYYANSVAHLLGPFAESVRSRDALPAMAATGGWRG